jgi:membrane protease YdiL (CAAX protease family)
MGLLVFNFVLGSYLEWGEILKDPVVHQILTPAIIAALGIACAMHVRRSRYPMKDFGITWGDWRHDVPQALKWTGVFVVGMFAMKYLVSFFPGTNYYNRPVFDTANVLDFDLKTLLLIYIGYILLVPLQEFCARGVIQSELSKIFDGPYKELYAICLSSGLFSAFHLYQNMKFALLTLIPGIFWGWMFSEQKSLLGVSISHIIIGLLGITLLGVN